MGANKYYNESSYEISKRNFEHKPPYLQEALFLYLLTKNNFITSGKWLDYGAGLGNFNSILNKYFNLRIDSYDKYFNSKLTIQKKVYDIVFSSAVLEYIASYEPIEIMMNALNEKGVFIFHTVVCENIPKDPMWFYLLPFHCSFFTNKSWSLLMKKYGFKCSVYSPVAKTWALFKDKPEDIENKVNALNIILSTKLKNLARIFFAFSYDKSFGFL